MLRQMWLHKLFFSSWGKLTSGKKIRQWPDHTAPRKGGLFFWPRTGRKTEGGFHRIKRRKSVVYFFFVLIEKSLKFLKDSTDT